MSDSAIIPKWTQGRRVKIVLSMIFIIFIIFAPTFLSEFRLSLLGKFLTYAIIAIGLDLIWGFTGILSLGHGVFFGLGAYCTAMHLKLVASHGELPDFMSWSGVEKLPWFWNLFHSAGSAIALAVFIPMLVAGLLGYLTFRNRIKGAFFAILSQALVIITVTLFVGQQGYTGGTNGLTNFDTFLGMPFGAQESKVIFYYAAVITLILVFLLCQFFVKGRVGKLLVAIRDGENRVRFIGYNPVVYKVFIYSVSAGLAGMAGVLFVLQEGIISPTQMGIVPSIEMVLWVAVGGRGTLYGAVLGAVVVNYAKTGFQEAYPEGWLLFLGGLFIICVLFLPKGIVGSLSELNRKWETFKRNKTSRPAQRGLEQP